MINHLKEILLSLAEEKVRFVVCGGVALVLQGVERMTLDIDLSVDMEPANLRRFIAVMKNLNLSPRVPVPAEFLLDEEKRRMMIEEKNALVFTFIDLKNPYRQVDVFLTQKNQYDNLISDADKMDLGGADVNVASKAMLLKMKRGINPPRDKDLMDIKALTKLINKT